MTQIHSRYYTYIKGVTQTKIFRSYSPYIFSIITITILTLFAIKPTVSTILNLQKDITNHKIVLDAINKKAQYLTEAHKNYNELQLDTLKKINTAVPTKADIPTLVRSLEQALPQQSSASAIQVQPVTLINTTKDPSSKPALDHVKFTYNFEGDYNLLLDTLTNLKVSSRLISLDSISINSQEVGNLIISINGKAYYLK